MSDDHEKPKRPPITRREFVDRAVRYGILAGVVGGLPACSSRPPPAAAGSLSNRAATIEFERIEAAADGRIGVAALNLATGQRIGYRADERFAMCSTFKLLLGAMILQQIDRGTLSLTDTRAIDAETLIDWSPGTEKFAGDEMTIDALLTAMLTLSDNTAANVLLPEVGGPAGFTGGVRAFGDGVTRLDRIEPELNENKRNDPRDTTTPNAMLDLMDHVLFGDALAPTSKLKLRGWMAGNKTGRSRLRAGFDPSWQVGNRSGTSTNEQSNDIAFAVSLSESMRAPGPLLVASFANVPEPMSASADAIHARVAREVLRTLTA